MHRASFLLPPLLALLTACGGEIARIEGLPQTRDVSDVPWPRLVDTPDAPTDSLLAARGAETRAALDGTRLATEARLALPGPAPVATDALQGRIARQRAQAATAGSFAVDQAALSARGARGTQARAQGGPGVDLAALSARGARVAQLRAQQGPGVSVDDLRARSLRVAAARDLSAGSVDAGTLGARAQRVQSQSQLYGGSVDRGDLALRSQRVSALTGSAPQASPTPVSRAPRTAPAGSPVDTDELTRRLERAIRTRRALPDESAPAREPERAVERTPLPTPKPVAAALAAPATPPPPPPATPSRDRSEPTLSDGFRNRAQEAIERARERANAPATE